MVLLGAGSTIHANAPPTADVTAHIVGLKNPVVQALVKGLSNQRGVDGFNFEYVLYALEELDAYILRKRYPRSPDVLGGVLSAFTELLPEFQIFERESLLMHRLAFVNELARLFWSRTKASSAAALTTFFNGLSSRFDLMVFTLNYDNLVDQACSWFDGFTLAGSGSKTYWSFDARRFRRDFIGGQRSLAHLHGSVHFGFAGGDQIVKFERPDDAIASLASWPVNAPAPLISGFKKEAKLVRDPTPFGYYYQAFVDAMLDTPRFVMAGYSGNDPHVTTWLFEFTRVHGPSSRAVTIDVVAPYATAGPTHPTAPAARLEGRKPASVQKESPNVP